MVEPNSREALRGEEVAIFDFLAKKMAAERWAAWLKFPLEFAAARRYARLSQKLVGAGAEVGCALHGAVRRLHEDVVINLLETVATDIDAENEGATVLDLLLRSGADETLVDDDGLTAVDMANEQLQEGTENEDIVERMRELLANVTADEAWRRRGYWALCRVHPDRLQLEGSLRSGNTRADGSKGRTRRSRSDSLRVSSVRAEIDLRRNGGSWADVAAWVLGLGEDAIFLTVVGYL